MLGIMQNLIIVRVDGRNGAKVLLERHATARGVGDAGFDLDTPTLAWGDGAAGMAAADALFHDSDCNVADTVATAAALEEHSAEATAVAASSSSSISHGKQRDDTIDNERWRDLAVHLSKPTWANALKGQAQVVSVEGRHMVYVGEKDLLFLLAGTGTDFDELGLHEVLVALMGALREVLAGSLDSDRLMKHIGKVCIVIDQIWEDGCLASVNTPHVLANAKLKKAVLEV